MGLLAVSVDLDEVDCYTAVHGINRPERASAHTVYERALPRIARFVEDLRIPVTFFVVGRDITDNPERVTILRELKERGSEIANHTTNHHYNFCSLQEADIAREMDDAHGLMSDTFGTPPVGFRAPGYNITPQITDLLVARGYLYDSSIFPCPLYYSAKMVSIGLKTIKGFRTAAVVSDPRVLRAPTTPYRIGPEGVWSRGSGLAELPITVISKARFPFIGTALSLMGTFASTMIAHSAAKLPFVNLELHGIDFADMDGDGLSYLGEHQHDLRIPFVKRQKTLKAVIGTLLSAGLEPVTLANAATRVFA